MTPYVVLLLLASLGALVAVRVARRRAAIAWREARDALRREASWHRIRQSK